MTFAHQKMTDIRFLAALIGLAFEVIGLWILLGKNNTDNLKSLSKKKLDGLDQWQEEIDNFLKTQRKNHLISSLFIVIGICLQTFPEYFLN